ncbi:hypothetical protein TVAG_143540 [Trichomonas vaginalis G3]|uniref:Uncharacterized protein n=1 Tax=Trichomonas vaginalis (strain ATCC PRA-98 / G3) TaxID=412133 RepID=A2EWF0_TRIV3|nr:hypothetical protein TVAGG3_0353670 [Trichomonas vaginalis G3]EAY03054.1 hypothetical protein TVAG_143540 [Trichomonas vaginalis G3]KAI5531478.1 hypothetical protein TVAGG3_0353670 [Trichomonas vaginalis G3]|eukprot:XP_001315277.1 hypothetical protein [Trichomonas vaginalis G3]
MSHWETPDSFVKKSIFKNNTAQIKNTHSGLITLTESNVTVSECIFIENKSPNTFSADTNAILTVINCTGDPFTASSSNAGTVHTDKMTTDPFNLTLSLLSLGKCEAEHPFSFENILNRSTKNNSLVLEELISFNFSLESLLNLTKS